MNRTTFALLFATAAFLSGCSGFGNDPFGWGDDRTYPTAGMAPSQGPFPGDADQAGSKDQGTMDEGSEGAAPAQ